MTRARQEVPRPTGLRPPIPPPRFWVLVVIFWGVSPSCSLGPQLHPSSRTPPTPLPGLGSSFPGLTLGLLFFLAPPRAPPCPESAEILSPISIPNPVPPTPSPTLVVDLSDPCNKGLGGNKGLGVVAHFYGGLVTLQTGFCVPEASHRKGVSSCFLLYKNTFFFLFLNLIGREQKKNVHLKHLITPLPERISRRRRISCFFLRLSWVGTQNHEILDLSRHSGQGSPRLGARDAENGTICPTKRTIWRKQEQLKTAVDASSVLGGLQRLAAAAFLWRLRGFRWDFFSPQRYIFVNLVGRMTAFSPSSLVLILEVRCRDSSPHINIYVLR